MASDNHRTGRRKLLPFRSHRRGEGVVHGLTRFPTPPRLPVLERIARRFARNMSVRLTGFMGVPCRVVVESVAHATLQVEGRGPFAVHMFEVIPLDEAAYIVVESSWADLVVRQALGAGEMALGAGGWPASPVATTLVDHVCRMAQLDLEAAFLPFFEVETVAGAEGAVPVVDLPRETGWLVSMMLDCGGARVPWHLCLPDVLLSPLYPLLEDEALHVVPVETESSPDMQDALLTLSDTSLAGRIEKGHPQLGAVLLAACAPRRRNALFGLLSVEVAEEIRRRMARSRGMGHVFTLRERFVVRTLALGEVHTAQALAAMKPEAAATFVRTLAVMEPLFAEQIEAVLRQDGASVTAVEALALEGETLARRLLMRAFGPEGMRTVLDAVESMGGLNRGTPEAPFAMLLGVAPVVLARLLASAGMAAAFAVVRSLAPRAPRRMAAVLGALPPEWGGNILAALGRGLCGGGPDALLLAEGILCRDLPGVLESLTSPLPEEEKMDMQGGSASVYAALLRHGVAPLREATLRACRESRAGSPADGEAT